MSTAPEVLPPATNRAAARHRPIDLGHVAALTDEPAFFHEIFAFIFRIGAARSHVVKLRRARDDIVAARAHLRGAKDWVELRRVRGGGIVERAEDHPIADMAGRAGDPFLLVLRVIVGIRLLRRLLDASPRNVLDQGGLLVFERSVAVQADPHVLVLVPVGLKKRIGVSLRMDARLPFVINFAMAFAAGFSLEAGEAFRDLLKRNGMGIVRAQAKDHDRLDLRVVQIDEATDNPETHKNFHRQSHRQCSYERPVKRR